jgi:succinoglycan biosynthesis transport protein ExoP
MEEEIDLREYVNVIIRRWKWVLGITLVAVAVAAIVSFFLLTPIYEAKAGVVIVKSRSEVVFEPKYRTLTEEDIASRRKALEALVKSSAVAAEVIDKLGSRLGPEEREVAVLSGIVETESNGDLIGIKVTGEDAGKTTAIANAWGEAYEEYVNGLYGGRPQSPGDIQTQVTEAERSYKETQELLVEFLGDNQIETLTQEIESKRNTLTDCYATKQGLARLIADARAFRKQLGEGGTSSPTASSLSILLLQANAFMASTSLPIQPSTSLPIQPSTSLPMQPSTSLPIQLQLSLDHVAGLEGSAEEQIQDLDTLIAVLEARREEVQSVINEMTLQQEILQLQEQLEREQARKQELTSARDLAWETYDTLARKEAEVGIASQVTDTEVRFAVPAVEPKKPVSPRKKLNIAIAGVLGLMVGVFGVFFIEFLEGGGKRDEG